jgi:methylenetetrahydrofolate reductase (NADPH)
VFADIVSEDQKFKFANELITAMREKAVDTDKLITIFAGGYPETHVESPTLNEDLNHLKRKVEAGVDVILTQVVFSAERFAAFVKNCRAVGINQVPIIPGLYIPLNLKELELMLRITSSNLRTTMRLSRTTASSSQPN